MKNMKIAQKLILSFAIVALMAAQVGIVGILNMNNMNNASTQMYEVQTAPIPSLAKVIETLQRMRVNTREYILGASLGDMNQVENAYNAIESYKKVMTENLDYYSSTIVNAEARQLFDEARNIYDTTYKDFLQASYELAKKGDVAGLINAQSQTTDYVNRIVDNFDRCMEIKTEAAKAASDAMDVQARNSLIIIVISLIVAMTIAMSLAFYISGLISKPVKFMKDILLKIGTQGDLAFSDEEYRKTEEYARGKDEVGQSMDMLLTTVRRLVKVGQSLETVAEGDLTVELALLSDRDTMGVSLQKMLENLNHMFSEINSATAQVTIGSKQIADGAQSLAQGSTEQASAVQQLSASIAEVANKTKENADMATKAASLAGDIKQNAEKGNMQMDQMMRAVKEINEASQSISKVIGVIDNIAFQTNILALNAAVEAARAGQHGKGFAVVAEEVRSLASKSAEAAKETGSLIANSMEKAEMGARIAGETASSLVEIVSGINESSKIVGDIASSSDAQASAITEINSGIDQVAQVVQQNSATAEQSAAASEQMSGQANALEELVSQFKLKGAPARLGGGSSRPARQIAERSSYDGGGGSGMGMGKY